MAFPCLPPPPAAPDEPGGGREQENETTLPGRPEALLVEETGRSYGLSRPPPTASGHSAMRRQMGRLALLTAVHSAVDLLGGIIGPVLPAIRMRFALSLTEGVVLMTVLGLSCNLFQLAVGGLRRDKGAPFFLYASLFLASAFPFIGHVPRGLGHGPTMAVLLLLVAVCGAGVACGHPEGLRAVHALDRLPQSMASSVFMVGGFFGVAGGAWLASAMVAAGGLGRLLWLLVVPLGLLALLPFARVRVAVETAPLPGMAAAQGRPPFWPLFAIAIPLAVCSAFVPNLLPSCLHDEYGFGLSFGGASNFAYGLGGAAGAVCMGILAHRRGEMRCVVPVLFAGIPLMLAYVLCLEHAWAVLLLPGVGFSVAGSYPLIVSLAKGARGPALGHRMALVVGGVWGVAALVLLAAGAVADHIGIHRVLHLTYVCVALAAALAWYCRSHYPWSRPAPA